MRYCAMMAGPVFFSITMILLHPDAWKTIVTGFVVLGGVMAYINKKLP